METYQWPDVAKTRQKARADWEHEQQRRIPFQERIGLTVPWWLIIVAAVFFTLSIPHTAKTFAIITPTFGYVAPLGVEFGLLYTSFRRRQLNKITFSIAALEVLLFVVAIIVNGVGTLQAVADNAGLHQQSVSQVLSSFGQMSATRQVALVLVPLAALIIPIGTMVAGEGLASLFLETRERRDTLDDRWQVVAPDVEFYALRDAAINRGIDPQRANTWAAQIARNKGVRGVRRTLTDGIRSGQEPEISEERARLFKLLQENPSARELSVRHLADMADVGKTLAAEVMRDYPHRNGHGEEPR
jgi:hypothetical protein